MEQEKNKKNNPDQDPSKAMDSGKDVENSNDHKTDQDFPGYPHYPAKEDIMDQRTDTHRVDLDVENIPTNRNVSGVGQRFKQLQGEGNEKDLLEGQDQDKEDNKNEEMGRPQNVSNDDLANEDEIPGSKNPG